MEGKIYRIICRKTGKQYIGSTSKKKINDRLSSHKSQYKKFKETGINSQNFSVFEVMEENDYYIELIDTIVYSSKSELFKLEKSHIEKNNCVNKCSPISTKEETKEKMKKWFESHKEDKREYDKKYREKNKERIDKKYICECGSICLERQKTRHEKTIKHINYNKKML
jgi:hypothetical protein